jgi:hypothetical protein
MRSFIFVGLVMKERFSPLPPGVCPAGLSREQATYYLGISLSKFDDMRRKRELPPAKSVGGKVIYFRGDLDIYITQLPYECGTEPDAHDGGEW